ncbi:hypothetical protein H5407_07175 [Mitsuaria sp. WAJ17]|uniref:hypothetical protein n=1 Tax=Mitsuaria sp. WAJ17 TaxID=2761452 RepID=UPI00160342A6|nr:hypothetical protein [Mitsuaria sp. WAJ17]MBB2485010.1 hypothetical protein [Mitsuaria sp. WAJ17]
MSRRQALLALAAVACLLHPGLRNFLEASMFRHMLVLYPGLLCLGWLAGHGLRQTALHRVFKSCDAQGLLTVSWVTLVGFFWMVPAALDWAVLEPLGGLARDLSLALAGCVLAWRLPRLAAETLLFLAGNSAWMLVTAGALIESTPTRLCVSYRLDEQVWTGWGLIILGGSLGAWALHGVLRRSSQASA